jgi:hypothetical protein
MDAPDDRADRRRLRRSLLIVALSGGSAFVLLASALYSDSASVASNTFAIGTLDISSSPTSTILTASNMSGGDLTTGSIQVSNAGTLALRYYATSTTTENVLAGQLDLTVKSGVTSCTNGGFASTGTVLYGPADLGSVAGTVLFGDPTQGDQGGDRTLAASANETLCLQVLLPYTAGSAYQGLTTTATIALVAEQTANNP